MQLLDYFVGLQLLGQSGVFGGELLASQDQPGAELKQGSQRELNLNCVFQLGRCPQIIDQAQSVLLPLTQNILEFLEVFLEKL